MTKAKLEQGTTALPDDFDPMEMAAFLDGEANSKIVRELTESPALRAVAAAGLDQGQVSDVAAATRLAERAGPLAPQTQRIDTRPRWLGGIPLFADRFASGWRATAAGVVLGLFGFGAGLAGGIGIGGTGVNAEEVLISATVSDLFGGENLQAAASPLGADDFSAVFGELE